MNRMTKRFKRIVSLLLAVAMVSSSFTEFASAMTFSPQIEAPNAVQAGYRVKFRSNEAATELPEDGAYRLGTQIGSFKEPYKPGYYFEGWYYDKDMTQPAYTGDKITRDMTLYASMQPRNTGNVESRSKRYVIDKDRKDPDSFTFLVTTVPPVNDTVKADNSGMDEAGKYDDLQIEGSNGGAGSPGGSGLAGITITADTVKKYAVLTNQITSQVMDTVVTDKGNGTYSIRPVSDPDNDIEGFVAGGTYQLDISGMNLYIIHDGETQDSGVDFYNVDFYRAEVANLELKEDMIYVKLSETEGIKSLDALFEANIVTGEITGGKKAQGHFTYNGSQKLSVGDEVCIYAGEKPASRLTETLSSAAATYVTVREVKGNTVYYESADPKDVMALPETFPIDLSMDLNPDDGDRISIPASVLNISANAAAPFTVDHETLFYSEIGLEADSAVNKGDLLILMKSDQTGNVDSSSAAPVYGTVTDVIVEKDLADKEIMTISYTKTSLEALKSVGEVYDRTQMEMTEDMLTANEDLLTAQAIEQFYASGYLETHKNELIMSALRSEEGQKALEKLDADIEKDVFHDAEWNLVNGDTLDLESEQVDELINSSTLSSAKGGKDGGVEVEIKYSNVKTSVTFLLQHYKGLSGVRAVYLMHYVIEVSKTIKGITATASIEAELTLEAEAVLNVNIGGDVIWKKKWIIPYISDYRARIELILGSFVNLDINATCEVSGGEEDDDDEEEDKKEDDKGEEGKDEEGKDEDNKDDKDKTDKGETDKDKTDKGETDKDKTDKDKEDKEKDKKYKKLAKELQELKDEWDHKTDDWDKLYGIGDIVSGDEEDDSDDDDEALIVDKAWNDGKLEDAEKSEDELAPFEEAYQHTIETANDSDWLELWKKTLVDKSFRPAALLGMVQLTAEIGACLKICGVVTIGTNVNHSWSKKIILTVELFARKGSSTITDYNDNEWSFSAYAIGILGIKAGPYLEFNAGLLSTDLDRVGFEGEAGLKAMAYAYAAYEVGSSIPSSFMGNVYTTIGAYLEVSLVAEMVCLGDAEVPLVNLEHTFLRLGNRYSMRDFVEPGEWELENEAGATSIAIPDEMLQVKALDMLDGSVVNVVFPFGEYFTWKIVDDERNDPKNPRVVLDEENRRLLIKDTATPKYTVKAKLIYNSGIGFANSKRTTRDVTINVDNTYYFKKLEYVDGDTYYLMAGDVVPNEYLPQNMKKTEKTGYNVSGWKRRSSGKADLIYKNGRYYMPNESIVYDPVYVPAAQSVKVNYYVKEPDTFDKNGERISGGDYTLTGTQTLGGMVTHGTLVFATPGFTHAASTYQAADCTANNDLTGYSNGIFYYAPGRFDRSRLSSSNDLVKDGSMILNMAENGGNVPGGANTYKPLKMEFVSGESGVTTEIPINHVDPDKLDNIRDVLVSSEGGDEINVYLEKQVQPIIFEAVRSDGTSLGLVNAYSDKGESYGTRPYFIGSELIVPEDEIKSHLSGYEMGAWLDTVPKTVPDLGKDRGKYSNKNGAKSIFKFQVVPTDVEVTVRLNAEEHCVSVDGAGNSSDSKNGRLLGEVKLTKKGGDVLTAKECVKLFEVKDGYTLSEPDASMTAGGWDADNVFNIWVSTRPTVLKLMDQNGKVIYEKEGYCEDKFLISTDTLPLTHEDGKKLSGYADSKGRLFAVKEDSSMMVITIPEHAYLEDEDAYVLTPVYTEDGELACTVEYYYDGVLDHQELLYVSDSQFDPAEEAPEIAGYIFKDSEKKMVQYDGSISIKMYYISETYEYTFHFIDPATGKEERTETVSYGRGEAVELPFETPEIAGYQFEGWKDAEGNLLKLGEKTYGKDAGEYFAAYTAAEYKITLHDEFNEESPIETSHAYGLKLVLPVPDEVPGYTFKGWKWGTDPQAEAETVTSVDADRIGDGELCACWEANTYTVTLVENGGKDCEDITYQYKSTSKPDLPEITRTGYRFDGWYESETFEGSPITSIDTSVMENRTLYAKWTANTYTVTLVENGGEDCEDLTYQYKSTAAPNLPELTRPGYRFDGWYESETFEGSPVTAIDTSVTGDRTLYAKWADNAYTVTLEENGGQECNDLTYQYKSTTAPTLPVITRTGYAFDGWYESETFAGSPVTSIDTSVMENRTLYAKWTANTYTVTLVENGGDECNDLTYQYESTTAPTLPEITRTGYTFGGWYESETFEGSPVTSIDTSVMKNRTLYAKWTEKTIDITYKDYKTGDAWYDGVVNSNPKEITFGGNTVTLQNPGVREGYTFRCWTLNQSAIEPEPVTVLTPNEESIVVYAVWDPISYNLTWELDNGQAPAGVTYPNAYTVEELPLQPAAPVRQGYEFTGWKVTDADGAEVSLTDGKVPAGTIGNLTFIAEWEVKKYTITYDLGGGKWKSSPKGGELDRTNNAIYYTGMDQSNIVLGIPERTGYIFKGWTETGKTEVLKDVTVAPSDRKDLSYTAVWMETKPVEITFNYPDQFNEQQTETLTVASNKKVWYQPAHVPEGQMMLWYLDPEFKELFDGIPEKDVEVYGSNELVQAVTVVWDERLTNNRVMARVAPSSIITEDDVPDMSNSFEQAGVPDCMILDGWYVGGSDNMQWLKDGIKVPDSGSIYLSPSWHVEIDEGQDLEELRKSITSESGNRYLQSYALSYIEFTADVELEGWNKPIQTMGPLTCDVKGGNYTVTFGDNCTAGLIGSMNNVENLHLAGAVTVTEDFLYSSKDRLYTSNAAFGLLAERIGGNVINCSSSVDIHVIPGTGSGSGKIALGGLIGYIDGRDSTVVRDCDFDGTITFDSGISESTISEKYVIGSVVGHFKHGSDEPENPKVGEYYFFGSHGQNSW